MKFQGPKYWGVRITFYPDRTPALQLVRLLSPDGSSNYQKMHLTNDSINLILLKDQFGVSLNGSITDSVKANVTTVFLYRDSLSINSSQSPLSLLGESLSMNCCHLKRRNEPTFSQVIKHIADSNAMSNGVYNIPQFSFQSIAPRDPELPRNPF